MVAWLGDGGTSPVHPEQIYRVAIEVRGSGCRVQGAGCRVKGEG